MHSPLYNQFVSGTDFSYEWFTISEAFRQPCSVARKAFLTKPVCSVVREAFLTKPVCSVVREAFLTKPVKSNKKDNSMKKPYSLIYGQKPARRMERVAEMLRITDALAASRQEDKFL